MRIEPAAVVIYAAGDNRVIGLTSAETSLEELVWDVSGLRIIIEDNGKIVM